MHKQKKPSTIDLQKKLYDVFILGLWHNWKTATRPHGRGPTYQESMRQTNWLVCNCLTKTALDSVDFGQYLAKGHISQNRSLIKMATGKFVRGVLFSSRPFIQVLLFTIFSLLFALPAIRTYQKREVSNICQQKKINRNLWKDTTFPISPALSSSDGSKSCRFVFAGDGGHIWEGDRRISGAFHHYFGKERMEVVVSDERFFTLPTKIKIANVIEWLL